MSGNAGFPLPCAIAGRGRSSETAAAAADISRNLARASEGVLEAGHGVSETSIVTKAIAKDIAEVDEASRRMNESARQSRSSMETMATMAERLSKVVGTFRLE